MWRGGRIKQLVKRRSGEDKWKKEGGRALLICFFKWPLFLCNCFYAVVLFSIFVLFIDEGAIKLGEGMDVVAPVHRGFLLCFIFDYFCFIGYFVAYAGVWSEGNMFFLSTIMQAGFMQETCQGPKEVVVTEDGVSISITRRHNHRKSTDRPDRQERRAYRYKKAHTASKQARSLGRP